MYDTRAPAGQIDYNNLDADGDVLRRMRGGGDTRFGRPAPLRVVDPP